MAGKTKKNPGRKRKAARLHPEAIAADGAQKSSGVEQAAERSDVEAFLDEDSGNLKAFVEAPSMPRSRSAMCIEPPFPLQIPVRFP